MSAIINFIKKIFRIGSGKITAAVKGEPIGVAKLPDGRCLFCYNPETKVLERMRFTIGETKYKEEGYIYLYALNFKNADRKLRKQGHIVHHWQ